MPASSAEQSTTPSPLNERAYRLFSYLRELTALNMAKVTDLAAYDNVAWLDDTPKNDSCFSILRDEPADGDTSLWLEIRKRAEPRCPMPPKICEGWFSWTILTNATGEPTLLDSMQSKPADPTTGDPPTYVRIEENPQVSRAWSVYVSTQWKPWSDAHREWKKHHDFYSSLFSMEQQVKRLGEAYELLVGLGLLTWVTPKGERIRRHLVVARALLSFDPKTGTITLRAAAEGAKTSLEYDMLEPDLRPEPGVIKACEAIVGECHDDLWDGKLVPAFKSWANGMSDRGFYSEAHAQPGTVGEIPCVTFAPALLLRRRTRRSLISLLQSIAERLQAMPPADIPFGVRRLCEIVSESEAPADESSNGRTTKNGEIYFPLPSNQEQRLIVERLRANRGVLVQGPPGTGKSQTIANLICHLLAEGKRILVTSQTERALKVLQKKLPDELQPLCVTVLGADETALRGMEKSVSGINERHTNWEPIINADTIRRLEQELQTAREAKAVAEARLRNLREIEFKTLVIADGVYQGTAGAIARRLDDERSKLSWIADPIPSSCPPPVSESELRILHETLRDISPERRRECPQNVAIPTSIKTPAEFVELVRAETEARARLEQFALFESSQNKKNFGGWTTDERQRIRADLERLRSELLTTRQIASGWLANAVADSLSGRSKPWLDLLAAMEAETAKLDGSLERSLDRELDLPDRPRNVIRGDAEALLEHLQKGGGFGWGPFRAKIVARTTYITREVRVNGRLCDAAPVIEELVEHLVMERRFEVLWTHCSPHVSRIQGPLRAQLSEIEQFIENLSRVRSILGILEVLRQQLRGRRSIAEPNWSDDASIEHLIQEIEAAEAERLLADAQASFAAATLTLEAVAASPGAHRSVGSILVAIRERSVERFATEILSMQSLLHDRQRWNKASEVASRLRAKAPKLTGSLEADPKASVWPERFEHFASAWAWSRGASWLSEFLGGMDATALESEVRRLENKISITLETLAAQNAWKHCLTRLTEGQRQHMIAWKDAIRRIGKGTGARAPMFRAQAREHMEECRSAIPAWIMPFYRIAETISDQPEPYDVVIVDESSQSGPEACALMYLAKRCIIVGDDKQISPEAVGIQRAQVDQLTEQYLFDIEHSDSFGVESSLFSQAQIRFGGRIRLREHFRCMPEIIRFSNDLCYQDEPLLPLRQYPPNRLAPIVTRHSPHGSREGAGARVRNQVEADGLVEALVACLGNPAYKGKTMGVISLLGEGQAQRIREMVISRVEPREIEEREITFGDAYEFQGDERDIIFLSMVAATNTNNGALTNNKAEQRFNVAASRARDQVWLFHSVMPADLNNSDVRYRLLSYYLNPEAPPSFDPDWAKCESKFEETVGKIVHGRGYRIIPQFEPFGRGGKRLDHVIEGTMAKLALECDGDEFHSSPEDIHNDLVRQRQLERCGWVFWRIRESEFYWDRVKSMEPLWRRLSELGIAPHIKGEKPPPGGSSSDQREQKNPEPPPPASNSSAKQQATMPPNPPGPTRSPQSLPSLPKKPIFVPRDPDTLVLTSDDAPDSRIARTTRAPLAELTPTEKLILDLLALPGRLDTNRLTLEVVRRLGSGQEGRYKVELALRDLQSKGRIRLGVNYVERLARG